MGGAAASGGIAAIFAGARLGTGSQCAAARASIKICRSTSSKALIVAVSMAVNRLKR
jgi:hypothetical protein